MAIFSIDKSVCDIAEYVFTGLQFCWIGAIMSAAVNYSNGYQFADKIFHSVAWFCIFVTPLLPGWNCLSPTSPAAHWSLWSGTTPSPQSACGSSITSSARRRWQRGPTTPKLRQVLPTSRVWPMTFKQSSTVEENCEIGLVLPDNQ